MTEVQADDEGGTLIARKVGEAVQNTLGAVVTAIDIPLGGPGQCLSWIYCMWQEGFQATLDGHFDLLADWIEFGARNERKNDICFFVCGILQ